MYNLTIIMHGKRIDDERPLLDPFVTSYLTIGFWDRVRSLFKKDFYIMWKLNADKDTIFKVMNLDKLEVSESWREGHNLSSL